MSTAAAPLRTAERPRPSQGTDRLLPEADRHLVSRFSYGITPRLARDVRRTGGAHEWFERQLRPSAINDRQAGRLSHWWPSLHRSPAELWQRQADGIEGGWEVMDSYARWVLMRRITSKRQVLEMMAEFWEHHLHVAAVGDPQFTHRVDYGDTIRKHALGRFDELLLATAIHPAMLIYLDAGSSTKEHPNENLGRELLELHTVGAGNFTDKDVRDSARILTGFSVDYWESWRAVYNHDDHDTGKVKVKGFRDRNRSANGKAVTARYLRYLARHPDTAERIATRLAVKFVADEPSPQLVRRLARVYLANDTAIVPVLRELVSSRQFAGAAGEKVRDPGEDVVATYRVLGVRIDRPTTQTYDGSAVEALTWQAGSIGVEPFAWGMPNGQPIDNEAWSSPARLLASMRFHQSLAGGWPRQATHHRDPERWLSARQVRFDELVDHLAQQLLHRRSSRRLLKACATAVDVKPHDIVDKDHELVRWKFPRLLTTLLDSPDHLGR